MVIRLFGDARPCRPSTESGMIIGAAIAAALPARNLRRDTFFMDLQERTAAIILPLPVHRERVGVRVLSRYTPPHVTPNSTPAHCYFSNRLQSQPVPANRQIHSHHQTHHSTR